ncbi:hypothetical protein PT447_00050 [Aliarcobacter butzleri]|uniref:hypothetical protein n=1 Tax=Aliarcobacter butzleri TaxID=28197 RepID=UPI0024DEF516|nr:hypothetical protein [Aliarcobacter butzleri]MDK2063310.1 hypothetical protein [Aliarcobacter butzleri]
MAINKKIAKEILEELGLDKTVSEVVLTVLTLKEKDFDTEFESRIQVAEKELERAKEKYKEKREKTLNDSLVKVISQTLKDLKIEIPSEEKREKIEEVKNESLKTEEVEKVETPISQNVNFENRGFNPYNQNRN